jgi:hypothetical protein
MIHVLHIIGGTMLAVPILLCLQTHVGIKNPVVRMMLCAPYLYLAMTLATTT